MAENIQRSRGRSNSYKPDAGGVPIDIGLYVGRVKNNVDTARTGQLDVYIPYLGGPENDPSSWKKVSYISPFYGATNLEEGNAQNTGLFTTNPHSYGMWFTPPDLETEVVCFFAQGDPNQGFYFGSVVNPNAHHMLPGIGASPNWVGNNATDGYFAGVFQMPVVEINEDSDTVDNPRFFDNDKPVHKRVAYTLLQQGLISDPIRGPISSNSYRESPSTVFGISTPGRPIWQGGLSDVSVEEQINDRTATYNDFKIIGRRGGHSIVMDDGSIGGQDQLMRMRTSQGHQILMSDDGQFIHIIHANGQSWVELGKEGTVDVYASNSVNLRTTGDLNFHADRDINLNAGRRLNMSSDISMNVESRRINFSASERLVAYSNLDIGIKSDGTLSVQSKKNTSMKSGENIILHSNKPTGKILLNSQNGNELQAPTKIPRSRLPDVFWTDNVGWEVKDEFIDTIVPRAPTHEPYPGHNGGVNNITDPTTFVSPPLPEKSQEKVDAVKANTPVEQPVTTADAVTQPTPTAAVGSVSPEQLQGMLAQADKSIAQAANELSETLGAGKFGLSPEQLEKAGVLKPGTVANFAQDSSVVDLLSNASNFTGQSGITNIDGFLNDPSVQDFIKTNLYDIGLNELKEAGLATGLEESSALAGLIEVASKTDINTVKSWIDGNLGTSDAATFDSIARGAQFGVDFMNEKFASGAGAITGGLDSVLQGVNIDDIVGKISGELENLPGSIEGAISDLEGSLKGAAASLSQTFDRSGIDQAALEVIDDLKVAQPEYTSKETVPTQTRRIQSNGTLTNFSIDRSQPYVIITLNGQPTQVYGPENLLRRYYSQVIAQGYSSFSEGSS